MSSFAQDSRFSARVRAEVERQLRPENLPPEFSKAQTEFTELNLNTITAGQVVGAERYDRQIDVDATQQVVQATTDETTIYSYTLGGGTLGTQGCVELILDGTYLNSSGSDSTTEIKFSYGGTVMYEDVTGANTSQANRTPLLMVFRLMNADATNSQKMHGRYEIGPRGTATTTGLGPLDAAGQFCVLFGTATVDSTLNKEILVSIQHSNNSSNTSYHKNYALLTKIGH